MTPKSDFLLLYRGSCLSKCSYFDVVLLNKKMVITEIALKSGFALILHALKSRFHCTLLLNTAYLRTVGCHFDQAYLLPFKVRTSRLSSAIPRPGWLLDIENKDPKVKTMNFVLSNN